MEPSALSGLSRDIFFMREALGQAHLAEKAGEVPVGAVVVCLDSQKVVARGFNRKEGEKRATAHAEILAIEGASQALNRWRLNNCALYVTLEPCVMCAGAIQSARLKKLVYGATDPKGGAVHSLYRVLQDKRLNHQVEVVSHILQKESSSLLKNFFKQKRFV